MSHYLTFCAVCTDVQSSPTGDSQKETPQPTVQVTRPSLSSDAESLTAAADDDFARLAKARSNPDILRCTVDDHDIRGNLTPQSLLLACSIHAPSVHRKCSGHVTPPC